MITRLTKHGEEHFLVIAQSLIEQLGIDESTPLEQSTDGRTLVITPVLDEQRRKRFEAALASINERYSAAFKRLAE